LNFVFTVTHRFWPGPSGPGLFLYGRETGERFCFLH
jgi:hypothetical protein